MDLNDETLRTIEKVENNDEVLHFETLDGFFNSLKEKSMKIKKLKKIVEDKAFILDENAAYSGAWGEENKQININSDIIEY